MSVERIAEVLIQSRSEVAVSYADWITGSPCEGSKFHSPTPILVRPHDLAYEVQRMIDWPPLATTPEQDVVYLCSTCSDNLTVYLSVLYAYDGATPQSVRRDFGNIIRSLGDRAWQHHLKRSA